MNNEIELPDDAARLRRCEAAGFSPIQAESMVKELFQIENSMQKEANARFNEVISRMDAGFAELRSEMKELRSEMASKAEVAAAVSKAGRVRMVQFISWGIAVGLAVLAFIGGTFVP